MTDEKKRKKIASFKIAGPNKVHEIAQAGQTLPLVHKQQNGAEGRQQGRGIRSLLLAGKSSVLPLPQQVIRKQFLFQPLMEGGRILMLSFNVFLATK